MANHNYAATITWTGNKGEGTTRYDAYERSHTLSVNNKPDLACSSDVPFRGDGSKYNPEDMFLYSLSSCHMLWYLHLCSEAGIIVVDYQDKSMGVMEETHEGGGHFTEVTLYPHVKITDPSKIEMANELHIKANKLCFIANSCNFPIHHKPVCEAI